MPEGDFDRLLEIGGLQYEDVQGEKIQLLTPAEYDVVHPPGIAG